MRQDSVDHWSFIEGVTHPLGHLADACLGAFAVTGDTMLQEAANALRAIETVDLSGCDVTTSGHEAKPLPWRVASDDIYDKDSYYGFIDEPILATGDDNPVLVTNSGFYPPQIQVCESIVDCMNTVYCLQQKGTIKNED